MVNTEQEIWRPYPKIPWIEASNLGRIRTVDREVTYKNGAKHFYKGQILKQWCKKNGYMCISTRVNNKPVNLIVHRIVATCFIPNPNNLPEVNHIDNDRTNNVASNLEWCTNQDNQDYRKNFGTSATELFGRPMIAVNPETSKVSWFESQHEAGRQLGADNSTIAKVAKGKLNKTHGYWFCYADKNAVEKARSKFGDDIADKVEKLINEHRN